MKWAHNNQPGFTIVELLIVVVVIAILVAITIVSYNGISQRATAATLQSETASAVKAAEAYKTQSDTGVYPSSLSSLGFNNSSTITYYYDSTNNLYCVQSKKDSRSYSATSTNQVVTTGSCSDNGLIGWWRLNGNADDSSANAYNGTASNTTSSTGQNGQANQAFTFTSASTSNVTVAHNTTLGSDPQTFSFWIRPTSWASANASVILSKRSSTTDGYYIAYTTSSLGLVFDCGTSTSPNRWIPGYAPTLNTWTHVVFTCSSDTGVALYVNGAYNNRRTSVNRSAMTTSTKNLKFGQDSDAGAQLFNGAMDDIRIYNRVLTVSEVNALYTAGAQ